MGHGEFIVSSFLLVLELAATPYLRSMACLSAASSIRFRQQRFEREARATSALQHYQYRHAVRRGPTGLNPLSVLYGRRISLRP